MCESDVVQLRPAVDVLVVPYSVHLLVCYLNKLQNARCKDKEVNSGLSVCIGTAEGVQENSMFSNRNQISVVLYFFSPEINYSKKIAYKGCLQKNGAVSKINKKFISHLTRAKRTPSAAATVQVSHALPAVRFSCLMRGSGASFQDGVAAGKGFLCAPF